MRSNVLKMFHLGLITCTFLFASCSKSTEAVSRQEQEEKFADAFGFNPPKSLTEINYSDAYNRHLMDGGYGQWMRFTFNEDVFAKILKEKAYKQETGVSPSFLTSKAQPKWWQAIDHEKTIVYSMGHEDTKELEGFSFRKYIWHDSTSNYVYFHKRYWD